MFCLVACAMQMTEKIRILKNRLHVLSDDEVMIIISIITAPRRKEFSAK